jgi:hypothetical protein
MKKIQLILAITGLLYLNTEKTQAQFSWNDREKSLLYEGGISFGLMNCLTDLGGNGGKGMPFLKDLNIGNNRINGSLYLGALYKYMVGLRIEGTIGRLNAYDSILIKVEATNPGTSQGRYQRNLHFKSKINEIAVIGEVHLLTIAREYILSEDRNIEGPPRLSPYLLAGVGYYTFNPQAFIRGNWVDLQPLSLEGQGFSEYPSRRPYKLNGICVPVGLGFKYEVSSSFYIRLEVIHRLLKTDYLDDVSTNYINAAHFQKYLSGTQLQNALDLSRNDRVNPGGPTGMYRKTEGGIRGNPRDNDGYFTANLKIGFSIGNGTRENSALQQLRCPVRF